MKQLMISSSINNNKYSKYNKNFIINGKKNQLPRKVLVNKLR